MAMEPLRPKRGGFLRSIGLGLFIRDYLLGRGPQGMPRIDSVAGTYQADIFYQYKTILIRTTAIDRATRMEEKRAKKEKRAIDPTRIEELAERLAARMPYKANGCRLHSFIVYFSMLQKLVWVEATGREEHSSFQDNYPEGQPRKYFRITNNGRRAKISEWANPHAALYGRRKKE
jgi:hypothetical protein